MARKRGRPPHDDRLTPAKWRVINALRHGLSDAAIAKRRGISRDAVRFHVRNALAKLGLANRQELRHWSGAPAGSPKAREESSMTAELKLGPIGRLYRSQEGAAPGPESILYLKVKDIESACKTLFKDPEDRPLALMEQVPPLSSPA